jgi:fructokinase
LKTREIDVIAFGEALIDWVSIAPAPSLGAARAFEMAPGGAPANVAVALARLGLRAAFAGGLAPDPFGQLLRDTLLENGVDVSRAIEIDGTQTRMAYVLKTELGERRLAAFSVVGVADAAFAPRHAAELDLERAAIFHFGSVTLAAHPSDDATLAAVGLAREAGCLISFDPNIRHPLWSSPDAARRAILPLLSAADVVKVGDDEAVFLTGVAEPEEAALLLWEQHRPALLAVTLGAHGALLVHRAGVFRHAGFAVKTCEVTGAGDAFTAGMLRASLAALRAGPDTSARRALEELKAETLERALRDACALGALATTRTGAMAGLPTALELDAFLLAQSETSSG